MTIDYATLTHLHTCWAKPIDNEDYDMSKPTSNATTYVSVEIVDEPYQGRYMPSKYDDIFDRLRPNQRIKCQSGQAQKIGNALKKHLKKRLIEGLVVRHIERCHDGHGGIWMLFADKSAADEYERRKKAAIKTEMRPTASAAKAAK